MSRENVEIARRVYANLNRGDIHAVAAHVADDAEITTVLSDVEGGSYTGPDGIRRWWEDDVQTMFEDVRFEVRETTDFDDLVVSEVTIYARGKGSAVDVEQDFTHVAQVRDGKLIRFRSYRDRREALEAVGLSE